VSPAEKPTTDRLATIAGYHVWGGSITKRISGARHDQNGGYVYASVHLVHTHECRAWHLGTRLAPCTCGAEAAWQAFAERQGDADPFAGIRAEEAGMTTTNLTQPARFEAARVDGGWTVADLLCGTAIVRSRSWDGATAVTVMLALHAHPTYAAMFRWSSLDVYPADLRWDALVTPVFATSLDGNAQTDLPPGTTFSVLPEPGDDGLVLITEFTPGDIDSKPCRWLVDEEELRAASARAAAQGETR
jgi:hypothetical protein